MDRGVSKLILEVNSPLARQINCKISINVDLHQVISFVRIGQPSFYILK